MTCSRSAGERPMRTSASMPRDWKISTARGLSSSAIRTRTIMFLAGIKGGSGGGAGFGEGPVEPGGERFQVGGLHRGPGPDAQARRRVAIGADVIGRALGLEPIG